MVVIEEGADGGSQFAGGAEAAAPDVLCGEDGKAAFDPVEPTGGGGREVNLKARAFDKPAPDGRGLMGRVMVPDEVQVQFWRHMVFDGVQESAELGAAAPAMNLADDFAGFGIEGGEQAG